MVVAKRFFINLRSFLAMTIMCLAYFIINSWRFVMAQKVTGELYGGLTGQLFELGRQLRQNKGYPFDPALLQRHLQDAIEGRFNVRWIEKDGIIYKLLLE